jgi:hypothetical protein
MTSNQASGQFEIEISSESLSDIAQGTSLGRMSLDKKFHCDLEATSQGEMLSFRSGVQGSAGYVAMEKVSGTLHGRNGSFVLQHSSTMKGGVPSQSVTVVPDSGTDRLTGLVGNMVITIAAGQHSYLFDYELA